MRRLFVLVATAAMAANAVLGSAAQQVLADTGDASASTPSAAAIVATAEQYLGYPYAYIGDDPSTGFSCIGFVHFVFAQRGVYVPEDLSKAFASAPSVAQPDLQPGDLVFFQNTAWTGISHVDLYVGDGKMIGADTFQTGVQWDALSDPYWQEHYLGATRPLAALAGTAATTIPATASPTATPAALATATPFVSAATPVPPAATAVATPSAPIAPDASPTPSEGSGLALTAGATVTALHRTPVYNGPGDTYMGIDMVTPDVPLTVLQTDGPWVAVSYGGNLAGWVLAANLNVQGSVAGGQQSAGSYPTGNNGAPMDQPPRRRNRPYGADPTATTSTAVGTSTGQARAVITADVLFVRADPSIHARILRRVHAGDHVSILATADGWDYVSLRDGNRGWVSAQWVAAADVA